MTDLPARPEKVEYGTKATRNTRKWWQNMTGWSDELFEARRNAVMIKIREKWPDEKGLNGRDGDGFQQKQQVRSCLRPLVQAANESHWPISATDADRLEKQLQHYVSWALYLNRSFNLSPLPTAAHVPSYTIIQSDQPVLPDAKPRSALASRHIDNWSPTTSDDETEPVVSKLKSTSRTVESQSATTLRIQQDFDWDNVEIKIDASKLGLGTVWLPMFDLKPTKNRICHWADFELNGLYELFAQDTGHAADSSLYEFVYTAGAEDFPFYRQGAFKVVLRRFSQSSITDHILSLHMRHRTPQEGSAAHAETVSQVKYAPPQRGYFTPQMKTLNPDPTQATHNQAISASKGHVRQASTGEKRSLFNRSLPRRLNTDGPVADPDQSDHDSNWRGGDAGYSALSLGRPTKRQKQQFEQEIAHRSPALGGIEPSNADYSVVSRGRPTNRQMQQFKLQYEEKIGRRKLASDETAPSDDEMTDARPLDDIGMERTEDTTSPAVAEGITFAETDESEIEEPQITPEAIAVKPEPPG